MSYLIDTNVISELRKRERANPLVLDWFRRRQPQELFLSVLTLGELRHGIERVRRRDPDAAFALGRWLDRILDRFGDRILDVNRSVAERWGHTGIPDPLPDVDALIAATALIHDLVVVTRNVKHIAPTGVRCFNPFEQASSP